MVAMHYWRAVVCPFLKKIQKLSYHLIFWYRDTSCNEAVGNAVMATKDLFDGFFLGRYTFLAGRFYFSSIFIFNTNSFLYDENPKLFYAKVLSEFDGKNAAVVVAVNKFRLLSANMGGIPCARLNVNARLMIPSTQKAGTLSCSEVEASLKLRNSFPSLFQRILSTFNA